MTSDHERQRLRGKSSVVTGAARGIGRATAELFAREGASLVIGDVDVEGLEKLQAELAATGARVTAVPCDVSVPADVRGLVGVAVELHSRLDVVVANAGVIPLLEITEASPEDWDDVMNVDGKGMFLTCKYAVEAMRETGGSIVCLSSISGVAGQRGQSTYGPAKFVASGLTKHLAVECARYGIRVNAVAPGTIRTDRVRKLELLPGGSEYLGDIVTLHPLGRFGEPAEVAAAIGFLASDEASFITGAVLPVDGGYLAR